MAPFDTVNTYNSYEGLSQVSYNIISTLFSNENLWKLIYYTSPDALTQPALTTEQKSNLIWTGQENQEDYAIYLVPLAENLEYTSKVVIKLYCATISPEEQTVGTLLYALEIMCQSRVSMLSDGRSRIEAILEEILKTVNGREIGGASELYFNNNNNGGSRECGTDMVIDQKRNYCGYLTVFGMHYGIIKARPTNT